MEPGPAIASGHPKSMGEWKGSESKSREDQVE
jgi:hypothetical protein